MAGDDLITAYLAELRVSLCSFTEVDAVLEEHIAAYLKSTQEWEPADVMPAAERHFLQKKRRAADFASKQHP